jgi:hypothetical protein
MVTARDWAVACLLPTLILGDHHLGKPTSSRQVLGQTDGLFRPAANNNNEDNHTTDPILDQTFESAPEVATASEPAKYKFASLPGDDLVDFLRRPRVIYNAEWVVGTSLTTILRPWDSFFSNAQVKEKIVGYSRFRGALKIQILINGSPFHRGTAYASYLPFSSESESAPVTFNDGIITTIAASGFGSPNGAGYHAFDAGAHGIYSAAIGSRRLVPMSQRQHVRLYPAQGQGGEMILPFIFPHEFMPLDADLPNIAKYLGTLTLQSVGTLGFLGANQPENVDITILASFTEDYELLAPTTYVLQSGEAHSDSLHSATPSRTPPVSDWLGVVRAVGPTVARLMGFSNPPLRTDVNSFRIQNVPNLANTQLSARDEVLAAHPEVTLTATNDTLGGDERDMEISHLVSKPSYLTSFSWPALGSGSENNAILFTTHVNPEISPMVDKVGATGLHYDMVMPIPMDWVAQTYRLWQGSIVFSFEVVTTKFQKGRLKISYDPIGAFATADTTGRVYTKIIDISEEQKFEFEVPYMATTAWLKTPHTELDYTRLPTASSSTTWLVPSALEAPTETLRPYNASTTNGMLRVQVLNTLTNDLDAYVIVSVRAGEDFRFSVPAGVPDYVSLQDQYFLQSGDISQDNYVGEKSASIRDLCHRASACGFTNSNATQITMFEFPVTGVPRGIGYNGGDTQMKANGNYWGVGSSSPVSFYHWFSSAFACARSSHRVIVTGIGSNFPYSNTTAQIISVRRGITQVSPQVTTGKPKFHPYDRRPTFLTLSALGMGSGLFNSSLWSSLAPMQDSSSAIDYKGGSVLVPYQKNVRFSPSNCMYDMYRPVRNTASGSLIGEPIYTSPDGGKDVLRLAEYFEPVDTVTVVSNTDARSGGAFIAFTSAGSDVCFGQFCNAPAFFRSRTRVTFVRGSQVTPVTLVREKLQETITTTYTELLPID